MSQSSCVMLSQTELSDSLGISCEGHNKYSILGGDRRWNLIHSSRLMTMRRLG